MSTRLFIVASVIAALLFVCPAGEAFQSTPTNPALTSQVKSHKERHPEMRKAMAALQRAKAYLQHATGDFAGHRAKALDAVSLALSECKVALKSEKG